MKFCYDGLSAYFLGIIIVPGDENLLVFQRRVVGLILGQTK